MVTANARASGCTINPRPWRNCCTTTRFILPAAACWRPAAELAPKPSFSPRTIPGCISLQLTCHLSPSPPQKPPRCVRAWGMSFFRPPTSSGCRFGPASFDHVFVCFVLEHLREPVEALRRLRAVLKPGGTLTVIEGDHGSTFFHPHSDAAWRTIQCLIDLQAAAGGNALIGRELYPAVARGWVPAGHRVATFCLCGCQPSGVGGRVHAQHLHCDGRGRARAGAGGGLNHGSRLG